MRLGSRKTSAYHVTRPVKSLDNSATVRYRAVRTPAVVFQDSPAKSLQKLTPNKTVPTTLTKIWSARQKFEEAENKFLSVKCRRTEGKQKESAAT